MVSLKSVVVPMNAIWKLAGLLVLLIPLNYLFIQILCISLQNRLIKLKQKLKEFEGEHLKLVLKMVSFVFCFYQNGLCGECDNKTFILNKKIITIRIVSFFVLFCLFVYLTPSPLLYPGFWGLWNGVKLIWIILKLGLGFDFFCKTYLFILNFLKL